MNLTSNTSKSYNQALTAIAVGRMPKTPTAVLFALDPAPEHLVSRYEREADDSHRWTLVALSRRRLTIVEAVADTHRWEWRSRTDPAGATVTGDTYPLERVTSVSMVNTRLLETRLDDPDVLTAGTWAIAVDDKTIELPELDFEPPTTGDATALCQALIKHLGD